MSGLTSGPFDEDRPPSTKYENGSPDQTVQNNDNEPQDTEGNGLLRAYLDPLKHKQITALAKPDTIEADGYGTETMVEGMVHGMEAAGSRHGDYFVPNKRMLYASLVLTQQLYPEVMSTIRQLAGGGMIMLPSSVADFANPDTAAYISKTQKSPVVDSQHRVKLFKLAWDAVGSEFASRHVQYEMFYASASFVTRGHAFRTYAWDAATGLVDDFLASYDLPQTSP